MSDWPTIFSHNSTINSSSQEVPIAFVFGSASSAWPSANRGIFVPFNLRAPFLVQRLFWLNGTSVAGNVDCGIYMTTNPGNCTRLVSTGSTAQSGGTAIQAVNITPLLLQPGGYYMALSVSTTSATIRTRGSNVVACQAAGIVQAPSMVPLTTNPTLEAPVSNYLPLFGLTSALVI